MACDCLLKITSAQIQDDNDINKFRGQFEGLVKDNEAESITCLYKCVVDSLLSLKIKFRACVLPDIQINDSWVKTVQEIIYKNCSGDLSLNDLIVLEYNDGNDNYLELISHCITLAEAFILKEDIDDADIQVMFMYTGVLASICLRYNELDLLSNAAVMFIERLHQKNRGQKARDIAETYGQLMFAHGRYELAYYIHSCSYAYQGNSSLTLLYSLLSLGRINADDLVSKRTFSRIVKNTFFALRDARLYKEFINKFREGKIRRLMDSDDLFAVEIAMAHCLLMNGDSNISNYVDEMILKYMEKFCNEGANAVVPWLLIVLQIIYMHPELESKFESELCLFKRIIDRACYNKYYGMVFADKNGEDYLLRALPYLSEYFFEDDLSDGLRNSIVLAKKCLKIASENTNMKLYYLALAYLLAPSISRNTDSCGKIFAKSPYKGGDEIYNNFVQRIKSIAFEHKCCVFIVTVFEKCSLCLHIEQSCELVEKLGWNNNYGLFLESNAKLLVVRDNLQGGIFDSVDSEWALRSEKDIKTATSIYKINILNALNKIVIIRSHFDSGFPHNLYQGSNGEFLSLSYAVCLSNTRILWKYSSAVVNWKWGIWAPKDAGDFTINLLTSKIEDTFRDVRLGIDTNWTVKPILNDNDEISIIVAHGAKTINKRRELFLADGINLSIDELQIKSKVVFLFVCHSGKQGLNPFSYRIDSLVERILMKNAECVIAPCWPLHIDVANEYLKEFLRIANNGLEILMVHHETIKRLMSRNRSPAVWANLHYYGNPTVIINGS